MYVRLRFPYNALSPSNALAATIRRRPTLMPSPVALAAAAAAASALLPAAAAAGALLLVAGWEAEAEAEAGVRARIWRREMPARGGAAPAPGAGEVRLGRRRVSVRVCSRAENAAHHTSHK